jgi:hypothetical protein
MATTIHHAEENRRFPLGHTGRQWRIPRPVWILACVVAALLAGYQFFILLRPPADAIRSELEAAAGEMRGQLALEPSPAVLAAMRRDFSAPNVRITRIPASPIIAVTLRDIDRGSCVELEAKDRRIEGPVVVMLQDYAAPEDCGSRNEMTWWIMP